MENTNNEMKGQLTVLHDSRNGEHKYYRTRLYEGNLYTYEWKTPLDKVTKVKGWYLLNTVVRNPDHNVLDTTAFYKE
jgi:hypothetical protein